MLLPTEAGILSTTAGPNAGQTTLGALCVCGCGHRATGRMWRGQREGRRDSPGWGLEVQDGAGQAGVVLRGDPTQMYKTMRG